LETGVGDLHDDCEEILVTKGIDEKLRTKAAKISSFLEKEMAEYFRKQMDNND
jgi:hypothetical protein